jgi:hypothetical protein
MTDEILRALREAHRRCPNCRIANCDCDSKSGKWENGCHCFCHFFWMEEHYGKDWTWEQFEEECKKHELKETLEPKE